MSFLFILDPLEKLEVKTDTSLALMLEASLRGIKVFACELQDILVRDGKLFFHAGSIEMEPNYKKPPTFKDQKKLFSASDFSSIFMRKDPPVDEEFISALLLLRCYDRKKTVMINEPDALLLANEKLFGQAIAPELFSPTLISSKKTDMVNFAHEHQKIVLKPLFGAGGSGVMVFEEKDPNLYSAMELLSSSYKKPIILQKFIKNARRGDKRILLLGGEPLGAVLRVPQGVDHRANFHAGGQPQACEILESELELCQKLKPHLLALGLHFVGIDIIEGYLTEINVTSPTCLLQMDPGLSAEVIDYVLALVKKNLMV